MTAATIHRLDGLEPDNLLAFLALLGLLRSLEADDRERSEEDRARPRAAWDVASPPLRPRLHLVLALTREAIAERANNGLRRLAGSHDFAGRQDINFSQEECRALLKSAAEEARHDARDRVDLLAALMSDAAIKDGKDREVDPTPLCLLFGQGHQHFLDRLASVPLQDAPPPRGRGGLGVGGTAVQSLNEALFEPWRRSDQTSSFRWDPAEDVRYALRPGDPTDSAYKAATQHGANRLAAIALALLTLAPETRAGRVRPTIIGGKAGADGFRFAWPIWREPATLAAIAALLADPDLTEAGAMSYLRVERVMVAHRISVGKFMNMSHGRTLAGA